MQKIVAPISYRSVSNLLIAMGLTACVVVSLSGCVVGPSPYEDYTLARSAVHAAQEVDSAQFATGLWNRAEDNFRLGEQAWNQSENENAKKYFKSAMAYAERAENAARLKKFQTGDALP